MYRLPVTLFISIAVATLPSPLNAWVNPQRALSIDHGNPRPAGLPSPNPTRSIWTHSSPDANPLAREGSTGPLATDADVCILGSGITGVGTAYHLSEAIENNRIHSPLKVVLLEARDFCDGATGRNGGHLTPAAFYGFHARATKYGLEEARRSYALEAHTASSIVRLIQDHGWPDDVDLVNGGHVDLHFSDREIETAGRDLEAAVDAGWPLDGVVTMSKEEVEATFGAYHLAVRSPGHNLSPVKFVTKLYQLAKSRVGPRFHLALHTHTPVTAIEIANVSSPLSGSSENTSHGYALLTPRGTIVCSRVVHATNAYASHLLPFLAGPRGIVPIRAQAIATRASVGTDQITNSSWTGDEGREYWSPRPVKTPDENPLIVLGGAREAIPPFLTTYVDDDSTCHPNVGKALRAFLPAVFEGYFEPGQEPEMEWTGIMSHTAIGDPFVGPVDRLPAARGTPFARHTGQFIAAGYSGIGMPRAFGCAGVVAQMIIAELAGVAWTQPEWLPKRYLTWEER